MFWSARPFVRIFIFFAVGIFIAFKVDVLCNVDLIAWYGIVVFFLLTGFILLQKRLRYSFYFIKGVVLGLTLIVAGIIVTTLYLPGDEINDNTGLRTYTGVVVDQPSGTNRVVKAVVKIEGYYDSLLFIEYNRRAMLYFEKNSGSGLKYGDEIVFVTALRPPSGPGNPGEFDYKSFLKAKGIELTGYVSVQNYKIVDNRPPNILKYYALGFRNEILKALQVNGLKGNQYAVAAAMVLGYDDLMDDDIRDNYQRAGAMHVLCVSGLHVGVIYLVMVTLLGFLNRNRRQKIVKMIILFIAVWSYALLTGLAPSVLRATVMVSFLIIGNEVERDKDAYNTLAMSAVLLLVVNPGFLFDVGFQLSYAAVLGIVTFYWPIYRWVFIKNTLLDKVWSATAISMAAQLGAFPFAAHYFHFFPTWFLLSNLVIMLFSTFIISVGMLFILFSWVPLVSGWIAYLLSGLIFLMNYLIALIGSLPFSGIEDVYFPAFMVVVFVLILFTGFRLIIQKEHGFVIPFLVAVFLLIVFEVVHKYNVLTNEEFVIYNVGNNHVAVDFISGKQHMLLCDSSLIKKPKKIEFSTGEYRIKNGLNRETSSVFTSVCDSNLGLWCNKVVFLFKNVSIAIVDKYTYYPTKYPLEVDWIWMAGNGNIDIEKLKQTFSFKGVLLGETVYKKQATKIMKVVSSSDVQTYDMGKEGAFIFKLKDR